MTLPISLPALSILMLFLIGVVWLAVRERDEEEALRDTGSRAKQKAGRLTGGRLGMLGILVFGVFGALLSLDPSPIAGLAFGGMLPNVPLPQIPSTQVLMAVNTAIGLGSFGVSGILSSVIPPTATFSLPTVGFALLPAIGGMIGTTVLIVLLGRRASGGIG